MKFLKNMKIGIKITLAVTILMTLSISIIGIISYSSSSEILFNSLKTNLQVKAVDSAEIIASKVESIMQDVEIVSNITEVQSMNWELQKSVLLREVERTDYIRIGVIGLNGQSNFTDGSTANLSDKDYFKIALQGTTNIAEPVMSTVHNKLIINIATPIKDTAGQINGVLLATHDYTVFSSITDPIKTGNDGYAFVLNKQGVKIAHPNKDHIINLDNDLENVKSRPELSELVELEKKMINGENGFGEYFYTGIRKLMSFASIPSSDWSVGIAVSKDDFYTDLYALRTKVVAITVFFILIGFIIMFLISRYVISLPIKKLVAVSDRLSTGDVSVNIESDSKDEIGILMNSFNKMIHNIREQSENAQKIAEGNLNFEINQRSEGDVLAKSMKQVVSTLKDLVSESNQLTHEVLEGKLDSRGNTDNFKGGYADIVKGINNTLDAVHAPLDEASKVLGYMAVNDYSIEMSGKYKGMFLEFSEKVNLVRNRLLSVQDIAIRVSQGDTSRLDEFKKAGKRSENDKLMPAFIGMMESIDNLVIEVERLTNAASEGILDTRGDMSKFEGGYKSMIEGVNKTLDAIAKPLSETLRVLNKMSDNNFTDNINGEYSGSFKDLTDSINNVQNTLNTVLSEINNAAGQVASGSRQVSDSAQALSQGSTEQAGSIEELTASMEEIASQTQQNASNANQANELALTVKNNAVTGDTQMKEMLKAMDDINSSSNNISKIIKVIDEIAFQTNILALNAAVEAARAGQHGKGFAVVAEEVRNLAQRSANAAKETTSMIEGSINKVETGTKIALETANALNSIVDGVGRVAELVGQIALASNDQATGIAQVNLGISQVSEVTQTNSATSEESAAASQELSGQSELLKEMAEKFTLKKTISSSNRIGQLDSDIVEMLDNLPDKKSKPKISSSPRIKIDLNNKEFGKY